MFFKTRFKKTSLIT